MLFADGVVVVFPYMFVANLVVKMGNNDTSRTFFFLLPPFNVSLHRILCSTQTESDTVQFRWRTKFTLHSLEEKKKIYERIGTGKIAIAIIYTATAHSFLSILCVWRFFFLHSFANHSNCDAGTVFTYRFDAEHIHNARSQQYLIDSYSSFLHIYI